MLFRSGYYIQGIKTSENMGCDLVMSLNNQRCCVYCENQPDVIQPDSIQKLCAAKNYYHAKQSLVVTNKYLTEEAKHLAAVNNIQIVDRDHLVKLMSQVIRETKVSTPKEESSGSIA